MALSLEHKKTIVKEVADVAAKAHSAIAAEYIGLSSGKMTDLRARAREEGVYLRIVKNTLARRAFQSTDYECMAEAMRGPLVLAFSLEEPGAAARVIMDFAKENEMLAVRLISIGGQLLPASELERLAALPTKEQAISMLMATMNAPVQKLASTLNEIPSKLVRTVAAIRDQKEAA